jgi:pilus assembly protein Flp/PilA
MRAIARRLIEFMRKEDGPTAVEYAVMLALILVVVLAAVANIGGETNSMYTNLSLQASARPGGPTP